MGADDLTPIFVTKPDGPAQPVFYRQGVIQEWDPVTLENTVLIGRKIYPNLQVLGVAEAASYRTGTVVGIQVVGSGWAITGQLVTPGTQEAEDAITQISQRAFTATVLTSEATSSTSYTDLATVGPRVSNVRIPASGKARVTISAQFTATSVSLTAGSVGVEVSGDTSISPSSHQSLFLIATNGAINATRVVLFDTLPAGGLCTFTLKYLANGTSMTFANRDITVETL